MPQTTTPSVRLCPGCGTALLPRRRYCDACRDQRASAVDADYQASRRAAQAFKRPPAPEKHAPHPVQRVVALLSLLRKARGRVVTTSEIRRRLPVYGGADEPGEGERRLLTRDLSLLVARGMVRTEVTQGDACERDGVLLVENVKPDQYRLTSDEHAALTCTREALRPAPVPSALPPADRGPADPETSRDLDLLLRLLRVIEEHEDGLSLDRLAELVAAPRRAVVDALRHADELRGHDALGGDLFPGLSLAYDDEEHDEDAQARGDDISAATIVRPPRARPHPAANLGLDELGRFGYTVEECQDRLDLIEQALAGWAPEQAPGIVEPLIHARAKLGGWLAHLHA